MDNQLTVQNSSHKLVKKGNNKLISIDDLYNNLELAAQRNELNILLNKEPNPKWLKKHPIAKREVEINGVKHKVPVEYLPIGVVEYIATSIFLKTRTEIKDIKVIANAVVITVRVWVLDPITGDWDWQEGVGAAPIRTDKGAAATDFTKVQDSAVQTAAPAAKSYAEKDAFEKFGKIFGRDLNRAEDNLISYSYLEKKFGENVNSEDLFELYEMKKHLIPSESFSDCQRIIENKEVKSYSKLLKILKDL